MTQATRVWYEFSPADTLFLRGPEPMVAGVDYQTTISFPPPPSVLAGAMRTAVLAQRGITIEQYRNGKTGIEKSIGPYGSRPPFIVFGPFLRRDQRYYVPAPYTWYTEDSECSQVTVNVARPIATETRDTLGLKCSGRIPLWARYINRLKPLGGIWVCPVCGRKVDSLVDLNQLKPLGGIWVALDRLHDEAPVLEQSRDILIRKEDCAYVVEERPGVALDERRRAIEHKLFTAPHVRLREGDTLVWATDNDPGLDDTGILTPGGEQRFGRYHRMSAGTPVLPDGARYLAVNPVVADKNSAAILVAAGKLQYRGGWDLAKGFHKDMTAHYPPGTVFSENLNNTCICF